MTAGIASAGPATRTVGSYSSASLQTADDDAVLTSTATAVTAGAPTPNGVLISSGALSSAQPPRNLTVTTSASVGTYIVGSILTVTYVRYPDGATVTESFTLTAANGGETLTGVCFVKPGSAIAIATPAQNNASGAWKIGVGTARVVGDGRNCDWVRCTTAGNAIVSLRDDLQAMNLPAASGVTTTKRSAITIAMQADTDYPLCVGSIHESTTAAFVAFGAGEGNNG